jgi:hypothetical protein
VEYQHLAYILALAVGIASAGVAGSFWELITGDHPRIAGLLDPAPGLSTPFRVAAIVAYAPLMLLWQAMFWLIAKPLAGVLMLLAGLGWSFLQGVFILSQLFGIS